MDTVLIGGLPPEAEQILKKYLDAFLPDAELELLRPVGIKGKLSTKGRRPDTVLIIIDESLWQQCVGTVDAVLEMPKCHKYTTDDGLNEFLISKFGRLTSEPSSFVAVEPSEGYRDLPDLPEVGESTVGSVYDSAEVNLLREKLAKSEMLVRSLTQQLNDKSGGSDDDIAALTARIRELETQLESNTSGEDAFIAEGKVAKAERVLKEFDQLKRDLKDSRENSAVLEHDKSNLTEQVSRLNTELVDMQNKLTNTESKLSEIAVLKEELDKKQLEVDTMTDEISKLSGDLENRDSDIAVLREKADELTKVRSELENAKSVLAQKELELSNKSVDLESKIEELENLRSELSSAGEESVNMKAKLLSTSEEVSSLNEKIDSLQRELSTAGSTITQLTADIDEYKAKEDDYKSQMLAMQSESTVADGLKKELSKAIEEATLAKDQLDVKSEAFDKLVAEKGDLEFKLSSKDDELYGLKARLEELDKELESVKAELTGKTAFIATLESEKSKLGNEVKSLQAEAIRKKADEDVMGQYERDLLEEKRKNARLEAELEVAKKTSETGGTAELRSEIKRLQAELESKSDIDNTEVEKLNSELAFEKERRADLELEVSDLDAQIKEMEESVFMRMANLALPKVAFDAQLPILSGDFSRFYCIASGSNESSSDVYSAVRNACMKNTDTRYLVVDFSIDSAVDRAFGVQAIKSPIEWLSGAKPFNEFVADSKLPNVKVLSTSLAYMNDLFLLNIDWQRRLSELVGVADVVLINIGCMSNTVTKVLFHTMSWSMQTYIFTKATPVNLRTLILNLTGFREISGNVTVMCVGYEDKASGAMYKRLIAKYKAEILRDSDVLRL